MSKILIDADIHLGVPGRLQDILWALRVESEYAHRHGIDTILSLGDTFNDRKALDIDVLCAAHDFFAAASRRGQRRITFPGNHDMFLKHSWNINSLKVFQDVLTIIDTVKIIKIDGVRFWVLPFIHFENAYMRVLKKIEAQAQDGDVLLTHIGTMGAIKNVCFLLKDWSVVSFHDSKFDQVYTGHFHVHQQVGRNVWYPGSLIPFKFDEGDSEHGFLVYDLETRTHEFINIWEAGALYLPDEPPPPNYLTIAEEMLADVTPTLAAANIIRVAVGRDYAPQERLDIEDRLTALGARSVRWLNIAAEAEFERVRHQVNITGNADLFDAWLALDEHNLKGLDTQLLQQLHADVAKEADELYAYDEQDD